jgi:hypothetical protein
MLKPSPWLLTLALAAGLALPVCAAAETTPATRHATHHSSKHRHQHRAHHSSGTARHHRPAATPGQTQSTQQK